MKETNKNLCLLKVYEVRKKQTKQRTNKKKYMEVRKIELSVRRVCMWWPFEQQYPPASASRLNVQANFSVELSFEIREREWEAEKHKLQKKKSSQDTSHFSFSLFNSIERRSSRVYVYNTRTQCSHRYRRWNSNDFLDIYLTFLRA